MYYGWNTASLYLFSSPYICIQIEIRSLLPEEQWGEKIPHCQQSLWILAVLYHSRSSFSTRDVHTAVFFFKSSSGSYLCLYLSAIFPWGILFSRKFPRTICSDERATRPLFGWDFIWLNLCLPESKNLSLVWLFVVSDMKKHNSAPPVHYLYPFLCSTWMTCLYLITSLELENLYIKII